MAADFAGIEEKLKRTDENILNLQAEVSLFFQKCKYPVMPKITVTWSSREIQPTTWLSDRNNSQHMAALFGP
jgi:hypothetical protein